MNPRLTRQPGRVRAATLLALALAASAAQADDAPLLGSWRLKSFVREVAGSGERYDQFGAHPDGYIHYLPDGRMVALFVAEDQPRPTTEIPTDAERIRLHQSMLAYGGRYTVTPGKVVHQLDIAWNGARLGSDQTRYFTLSGNTLTLKTPPNKSPVDGRDGIGILVFEKVQPAMR